jgi:hypothetical protein
MWSLYHRAKQTNSRPSQLVEGINDPMARYCLDGAVILFGTIIENALLERQRVGDGKSTPKWTLKQLLDPTFTLPRDIAGGSDSRTDENDDSVDTLKNIDGGFYDEVG